MNFIDTLKDSKAFTGLVVAGFSAIMIGSIFLIISILVINSVDTAAFGYVNESVANGTILLARQSVITSIGSALTVSGVVLIVVGVAVIIAVLLGMVGKPTSRM